MFLQNSSQKISYKHYNDPLIEREDTTRKVLAISLIPQTLLAKSKLSKNT